MDEEHHGCRRKTRLVELKPGGGVRPAPPFLGRGEFTWKRSSKMWKSERMTNVRRPMMTEGLFRWLTLSAAMLLLISLIGIALLLLLQSRQSIAAFGIDFLFSDTWNPVKERFGALAPIFGTLVTSIIAMLVGVPLAFGVTFFLAELCPFALRGPLSVAIELLAAVPSIIFGMWGLFVLAPFLPRMCNRP